MGNKEGMGDKGGKIRISIVEQFEYPKKTIGKLLDKECFAEYKEDDWETVSAAQSFIIDDLTIRPFIN